MAMNGERAAGAQGEDRDPALDRLYAAGSREEPPSHVDAAILAAARREAGAGPARPGSPLRGWRVPLAMAAVVVLSVSVAVLMREEEPARVTGLARNAEGVPPEPGPAPAEPSLAPPPAAQPSTSRTESTAAQPRVAVSPGGEAARPAAEPVERLLKAERAQRAASPFSESAGPATASREAPATLEPQARVLSGSAQPKAAEEAARDEPGGAARPAAPAPAAAQREIAAGARPQSSGTDLAPAEFASRPRADSADRRDPSALAKRDRPAWYGLEGEPVERWIARIQELRREGRTGEADEVVAEFRRRYPGQTVPRQPDSKH